MIGDTASINLLTGLPGAGKSLRIVEAILRRQAAGDLVYTCNIDGLKVDGVMPCEDPRKWEELPPGSVLFVDEAQQFFPARRSGEPPEYIKRMSKIRHEGVRLVLATQSPDYLDTYIRNLVGFHEHLLRIAGKSKSFLFRNHQLMDQVRLGIKRVKTLYDYDTYSFPKELFKFYDSAQTHTVKYVMPTLFKKVLIGIFLFVLLFGAPVGYLILSAKAGKDAPGAPPPATSGEEATAQSDPAGASSTGSSAKAPEPDYVAAQVPRLAHQPWSAPIFDAAMATPTAKPELYCISSGAGVDANGKHASPGCSCITEQGTRYELDQRSCYAVVKQGGSYNPYRVAIAQGENRASEEEPEPASLPDEGPVASVATGTVQPFGKPHAYGAMGIAE